MGSQRVRHDWATFISLQALGQKPVREDDHLQKKAQESSPGVLSAHRAAHARTWGHPREVQGKRSCEGRAEAAAAPGETKPPAALGDRCHVTASHRSRLLWGLYFFWSLKQHREQTIHYQPEARNLKPNLTLLMKTRCQYFQTQKSKVLLWSTIFADQAKSPYIYFRDEIWSFQTGQRITGKGECGEERGK